MPACSDERFKKGLVGWKANIDNGGDIKDLWSMLNSKYTLSEDQKAAINALTPANKDTTGE